jgi:hypothetical protein
VSRFLTTPRFLRWRVRSFMLIWICCISSRHQVYNAFACVCLAYSSYSWVM